MTQPKKIVRVVFRGIELKELEDLQSYYNFLQPYDLLRHLVKLKTQDLKDQENKIKTYGRTGAGVGNPKKPKELRAIEYIKDLEENKSVEEIDEILRSISTQLSNLNFNDGHYFKVEEKDGIKKIVVYQPNGKPSTDYTIEHVFKEVIKRKLINY